MRPFFFDSRGWHLFGAFHEAAAGAERDCGVLLCYPAGEEYIRAHRTFLVFARHLARLGFPVLRFEGRGCGDSEGGTNEWSLAGWREDVEAALLELARLGRVSRVCVIGMRLGATLALLAARDSFEVAGVVLWDPVLRGAAYLEEIRGQYRTWLCGSFARERDSGERRDGEEIHGFRHPAAFVAELERLDLSGVEDCPAIPILLLASTPDERHEPVAKRLRAGGARVRLAHVEDPPVWLKGEDDAGKGIVPARTLERIREWLDESFPAESRDTTEEAQAAAPSETGAPDVV